MAHRAGIIADSTQALTAEIRAFCAAHDRRQFDAPKELAVAIAAEADEP